MKARKLLALLIVVVVFCSMIIPGCTKTRNSADGLMVSIGDEPSVIDPQLAGDSYTLPLINAVFEGLYRRDKSGMPMPGLAKSCDLSSDGLKYTFYLRDASWADGTPVTADDFKTAWLRALDPKPSDHEPSFTSYLLYYIKGAEEYNSGNGKVEDVGINVKDGKTLEVTLVKRTPFFLDLICNSVYMPINKSFYSKQPVVNNASKYGSDTSAILGNGPFTITEWKHDGKIVLEKNESYWNKDSIALGKVTFKVIKDASAAYTEFKAGSLDVADISGAQRNECIKNGYNIVDYDKGATVYLDFNNKDSVLKNANIRKALSYSLDRESFIKNLLRDSSQKALGFVNPAIFGLKESFRKESGDLLPDNQVSAAQALLQIGLKQLGMSSAPKITLLVDDSQTSKRDAQAYQDIWKNNLGIDVEISVMPFVPMREKMQKCEYQMALLAWGSDYNSPLGFLENYVSDNPNNFSGYSNPKYDELVNKSRVELDTAGRINMQIEAEKLLMTDMPLCPVYFIKSSYVVNKRVKNFVRNNTAMQDMDFYWASFE